jgi:hypothetical protein
LITLPRRISFAAQRGDEGGQHQLPGDLAGFDGVAIFGGDDQSAAG